MHMHPGDTELAKLELQAVREYKEKHMVYIDFLSQKAKLDWLRSEDENTNIFNQSLKSWRLQNQIYSNHDE